jgi:murein DD-endopeptidase MepM/ murein hydrolase activator NlpD
VRIVDNMGSFIKFYRTIFAQGSRGEREQRFLPPCSTASLLLFFVFSLFTFHASRFTLAQDPSSLQLELEQNITNTQALLQQREQEIASIEVALGELGTQLETQITERDRLSGELAALRERGAALSESVAALEAQLAETQANLEGVQVQVADLKTRVQELLVGVYKQRSGRYARVLTQADSLHDLQVKNYYLSLLSEQDLDLVTELSLKATELITLQDAQSQQMRDLEAQQIELGGTQVALEIKQGDLETAVANLNATQEGQLATRKDLLLSQANLEASIAASQSQLQAEITRLQEEATEKRRQAELAADQIKRDELNEEAAQVEERAENLAAPRPAMNADYASPVAYAQVLGKSGSGVAIRANSIGADVYAVQPGVVIQVVSIGANDGYIVVLEHGNGLITAYSNLQSVPNVTVGQQVVQGEVLGNLGGGALVPQDVLKFYVKQNDSYLDPVSVLGL